MQEVDKVNAELLDRDKTMRSLRTDYDKTLQENKRLQDQLVKYEILDTERQALEGDIIELRHQINA